MAPGHGPLHSLDAPPHSLPPTPGPSLAWMGGMGEGRGSPEGGRQTPSCPTEATRLQPCLDQALEATDSHLWARAVGQPLRQPSSFTISGGWGAGGCWRLGTTGETLDRDLTSHHRDSLHGPSPRPEQRTGAGVQMEGRSWPKLSLRKQTAPPPAPHLPPGVNLSQSVLWLPNRY